MQFEGNTQVLHWLPDEDRWELIGWNDFRAFRNLFDPFAPLPGVSGGVHYFIVCVHDKDVPLNLIPHKYLVEPNGRIGPDNFTGWTREEREDYSRLMIAERFGPGDQERLTEIQDKAGHPWHPPKESIGALVRALPKTPQPGSAAERFLGEFGS